MYGLIQLVAVGIPDLYLTGDPQISFFKILYRRHTEFSMIDQNIIVSNKATLGNTYNVQIPRIADMLHKLAVRITIHPPKIKKYKPTLENINKLLSKYHIKIDSLDNCDDIIRFYDLFKTNILPNKIISTVSKINDEYNQFIIDLDNILSKIKFTDPSFIAIHKNSITFTNPNLLNPIPIENSINYDTSGYYLLLQNITNQILSDPDFEYTFNSCDLVTNNIVYPNLNLNFTKINNTIPIPNNIPLLLISITDLKNSKIVNQNSIINSQFDKGYFDVSSDIIDCIDHIIKKNAKVEVKYDGIKKENSVIQKFCINQNAKFNTDGDYYLVDISNIDEDNVLGNKNNDVFLLNPCYIYSSVNYTKELGFIQFDLECKEIIQVEFDSCKIENPNKTSDILKLTTYINYCNLSNTNIIKLITSYYDDLLFCENRKKDYEISNEISQKDDIVNFIIEKIKIIIPDFDTNINYNFIIEEINKINQTDQYDLIENIYKNILLKLKCKFETFIPTNTSFISDVLGSEITNLDDLLNYMGYDFVSTNNLYPNKNKNLFQQVRNNLRTVSDFIYNFEVDSIINLVVNKKDFHTKFLSKNIHHESDLKNYSILFGKYKYNFREDIQKEIDRKNNQTLKIHQINSLGNILSDNITILEIEKALLKITCNKCLQEEFKNNQIIFLNGLSNIISDKCHDLSQDDIQDLIDEFDTNNNPKLILLDILDDIIFDDIDERKYSPTLLRNLSQNYNCFSNTLDVLLFMMDQINFIDKSNFGDSVDCVLNFLESNILERKNLLSNMVNDKFIIDNCSYPKYDLGLNIPEHTSKISYNKLKQNTIRNSDCDDVLTLSDLDNRFKSLNSFDVIESIDSDESCKNCNMERSNNEIKFMPIYYGTKLYEEIIDFFSGNIEYAWSKFLGYRLIERISFVVDGEEYDIKTSESLLLNDRAFIPLDHRRGVNELIGNTVDMFKFSSDKEIKELYIDIPFFHSKNVGSSFPLISTIHNDIQIQIKLRKLDDCIKLKSGYIDNYTVKLKLLKRFIYLEQGERIKLGKNRTLNLIERSRNIDQRFLSMRSLKFTPNSGKLFNPNLTIRQRYFLQDPTKYILFRVRKKTNDDHLNWSESNCNENIINRIKIQYNSRDRQEFKKNKFYQLLHPYNSNINTLNKDEYFYSFSLYPKSFQPSGSDNLSMFEDISFFFELNPKAIKDIDKIQIDLFTISYNVNMTTSGFSGLLFYGVRKS